MQNPKVTVLMPVYNAERYLRSAVDSILAQTFSNFEFLIIDDQSTDTSWDILTSYRDERMRLIRQPVQSRVIAALNTGLELARGEYIARMDADDISFPERLEKQVAYLDEHPECGLVSSDRYAIDSKDLVVEGPRWPRMVSGGYLEWRLYWHCVITHPTVVYRTNVVNACGRYSTEYRYINDYPLWLRMMRMTQMVILPQPLLYYRRHPQNVSLLPSIFWHNVDESAIAVQKALQERVGYMPSKLCVLMLREFPIEIRTPIAAWDAKQAIDLVLDVFKVVARDNRDEPEQLGLIRQDRKQCLQRPIRTFLLNRVSAYKRWFIKRTLPLKRKVVFHEHLSIKNDDTLVC